MSMLLTAYVVFAGKTTEIRGACVSVVKMTVLRFRFPALSLAKTVTLWPPSVSPDRVVFPQPGKLVGPATSMKYQQSVAPVAV